MRSGLGKKHHLNQNKGKRKRSRRKGGERRRGEEHEPFSPPLETVKLLLGAAVREPRHCHRPPPQRRQRSHHSAASEAVQPAGHFLLRIRYTFLPPLFLLVFYVFLMHAERSFCMQEDRAKIIPPTSWFSNAGPGRFWPSTDRFLSLGQAGSGPFLMCLWARLTLAQPGCLGQVWPRRK